MRISILTFDGFNEIDSLLAFSILNRVKAEAGDWAVSIAAPTPTVTSMNGLELVAQCDLMEGCRADVVLLGSGTLTRDHVRNHEVMEQIQLDPQRQLIGAQCSGTLMLATLGLLGNVPACTDLTTKPWVIEAGVEVMNQPFVADGNVATAGGCLAAQYLAGWVLARTLGLDAAISALHYVAPVGEKDEYVARALKSISPYLPSLAAS